MSEPEIIEAETVENLPAVQNKRELAAVPHAEDGAVERVDASVVTMSPFIGVSVRPFDERAQEVLNRYQHVPDEWIDIKPGGQVYLSHMRARQVFNEAFGFGGWGIVPIEGSGYVERKPFKTKYGDEAEHVTIYREYRFYVNGRFVRQAMGSGDYYTNNKEADYSDALEASESYALNRFAKFLGIASQCWDDDYREAWKAKYAVSDAGKWKKRPRKLQLAAGSTDAGSHPANTQPTHAQPTTQPATTVAPASESNATGGTVEGTVTRIAALKKGARIEVAGQGFSTFSASDLKAAEAAQADGAIVRVVWKLSSDGKWKNVVTLERV